MAKGSKPQKQPKPTPKFHQPEPQQNDQYNLQQQNNKPTPKQLTSQKPMQSIFDTILQQQQQKKVKKQKRIKKQTNTTHQKQVEQQHKQEQQNQKKSNKIDIAFKYVSNKSLEDNLRSKTLNGVVKVLNLISAHKKEQAGDS